MKSIKLPRYFQTSLILVILTLIWGCGSGGSGGNGGEPTPSIAFSNGASIAIVPSGNGEYVVQGNNLVGVAGIDLKVSYDSSNVSSPTVTQGALVTGSLFESNTTIPGSIQIGIINATTPISGSGQIAKISFATHNGAANLTFNSVKLIDLTGNVLQ